MRFLLRLPTGLHEELRGLADQETRSLNGQIEYLLRGALPKRRRRGRQQKAAPPADDGESKTPGNEN